VTSRDDSASFVWELPGEGSTVPGPGAAPPRPGRPAEPGERAEPAEPRALTVPEVVDRVRAALERGFPRPFWVVGETVDVRPHPKGHIYLDLVDHESRDGSRATLKIKIWARTAQQLFGARGRRRGFELVSSLVVRVLVRPDFWPQGGQLSFIVEDVDPDYTLGRLDRERRELLERLAAEGAIERNKARPLALPALRLGLVTAAGSAAWNDVMQTLAASGIGFRVLHCDARMQGEDTSATVRAALAALAGHGVDAILLVRGGGSRIDLSWFDREDIARAIAGCPVPVLTGIGHEIDTSVADLVAHRAFKTPTAAAEFLVEAAREARRGTEEAFAAIVERALRTLADERRGLIEAARGLRAAAASSVQGQTLVLREASQRLRAGCEAGLGEAGALLVEWRSRLARGRHLERLAELLARLSGDAARLGAAARGLLDRRQGQLELASQRARLLDPQAVLARGFAWLRRADGSTLKDAAAAVAGERLTALLRDGQLGLRALDEPIPGDPNWPRRKS